MVRIMDLDKFCENIRSQYLEVSRRADRDYDYYWNRLVQMEFSPYSWFESLARAINSDMLANELAEKHAELFQTISKEFSVGTKKVRNAIDVAFVENLFWQVPADKAKNYWEILPENLKELYLGFHGRTTL